MHSSDDLRICDRLIYRRFKTKTLAAILGSLVCGMLAGRIVWGIAEVILIPLIVKTLSAKRVN